VQVFIFQNIDDVLCVQVQVDLRMGQMYAFAAAGECRTQGRMPAASRKLGNLPHLPAAGPAAMNEYKRRH